LGVDVDSVIFVGKHTKDPREYFTEEQLEGFDGDWQDHGMDSELEVHPVSGYADYGWYVGFQVGVKDPEATIRQIRSAVDDFKTITGEDAEFHNWAYYW
jgi:hypothetical protein